MQKYKIVKSLQEFQVGRSRIAQYEVELPNGNKASFNRRYADDISTIIVLPTPRSVIMVRQYRFGADKISLEFPKGLTDGEDPKVAAARELKEETGYVAKKLEYVGFFHVSPAWNTQKEHVFMARDAVRGKQQLEPYEVIDVEEIALDDIPKLIKKGSIFDAGTVAAYKLFENTR